jgi:hypothetical protein
VEEAMKAFLAGIGAALLIALVAWFGLEQLGWNTAERLSSEAVRLDPGRLPPSDGRLQR